MLLQSNGSQTFKVFKQISGKFARCDENFLALQCTMSCFLCIVLWPWWETVDEFTQNWNGTNNYTFRCFSIIQVLQKTQAVWVTLTLEVQGYIWIHKLLQGKNLLCAFRDAQDWFTSCGRDFTWLFPTSERHLLDLVHVLRRKLPLVALYLDVQGNSLI